MTPTDTYGAMVPWLEDAWLGRYLDRLLSADELAWFEQYMLDKPPLLGRVEVDTRLRYVLAVAGRAAVMADGQPTDAPDESGTSGDRYGSGRGWSIASGHRRRSLRWFAVAAALVAGVGLGRLAPQADPSPTLIADPAVVIFDTMRGPARPPRLEQPGNGGGYALVEVSVPPGARDVTLALDGGDTAQLVSGPDGFARFLLRTSRLAAGRSAQVAYTVDGKLQSRPLSFELLHTEN